jgi:hypothetical protein
MRNGWLNLVTVISISIGTSAITDAQWVRPLPGTGPNPIRGGISGHPSSFGNVLFPGTGGAPGSVTNVYGNRSTTGAWNGVGWNGGTWGNRGNWNNQSTVFIPPAAGIIAVPFGVSVVTERGYLQQPAQLDEAKSPTVVINQNFAPETANPVVREYTDLPPTPTRPKFETPRSANSTPQNAATPAAPETPPVDERFVIVLRDGTQQMISGYGIQGDTILFVSERGRATRLSMDLVDLNRSVELNRERGLDFRVN